MAVQTKSKDILAVLGPYMNCIDVISASNKAD